MKIHLKIDIKAGPRTPIEVAVYGATLHERTIKFTNDRQITEIQIANWVRVELTKILTNIKDAT